MMDQTNGVEFSSYVIPDSCAIKIQNLIPENFSSTQFEDQSKEKRHYVVVIGWSVC